MHEMLATDCDNADSVIYVSNLIYVATIAKFYYRIITYYNHIIEYYKS